MNSTIPNPSSKLNGRLLHLAAAIPVCKEGFAAYHLQYSPDIRQGLEKTCRQLERAPQQTANDRVLIDALHVVLGGADAAAEDRTENLLALAATALQQAADSRGMDVPHLLLPDSEPDLSDLSQFEVTSQLEGLLMVMKARLASIQTMNNVPRLQAQSSLELLAKVQTTLAELTGRTDLVG